MATTLSQLTSTPPDRGLRQSWSYKDLHGRAEMRRSYSDNHLSCLVKALSSAAQPKLKASPSIGFFNLQLSGRLIPGTLKSLLFENETSNDCEDSDHDEYKVEIDEGTKRANWIERLVELRNSWKGKQDKVEGNGDADGEGWDEEGGCEVDYEEDEEGNNVTINRETFSSLLRHVSWSDTKHFVQLAFLCSMAYVIPDLKPEDLQFYGQDFVTSSLEKKAEAAAVKDKLEKDSIRVAAVPLESRKPIPESADKKALLRSSAAYEIAVSAASYVQSRAKDLISMRSEPLISEGVTSLQNKHNNKIEDDESTSRQLHKSEMAACVAASTMTAVVAAGENQREKAAQYLQSPHSSPCEWFICDDLSIYTRCFVIQGSDSLASWQANLFFEPTKFEGTDELVHRGIYEAAKGIYNQFMPEIKQHLSRFGHRAKLQFTGHSLGGSLALLVNLMLLTRKEVQPYALLPAVTFGSPFIFCGGHKILEQLGLDDNHVHCVMMHRDIVPRAFSCNYPNYVAQVLKRLNGSFRSHPCLNKNKLLYSPMGKLFILQPEEKSSPPHPLLPPGRGLYALDNSNSSLTKSAVRVFLNSPHPIETLSDPSAYGSDATIIRDHDSTNYFKAVNEVISEHPRLVVRKKKKTEEPASHSPLELSYHCNIEGRPQVIKKALTGV